MSTDEVIGANLARIREKRGLSLRKLAEQLGEIDHPINADSLNRAEKGRRQVTAADLLALAVVLDVSPLTLLLPHEPATDGVQLTPAVVAGWPDAWRWATGEQPLKWQGEGVDLESFRRENRPYENMNPLTAAGDAVLRIVTRNNIARMNLTAPDGSVWSLEKVER